MYDGIYNSVCVSTVYCDCPQARARNLSQNLSGDGLQNGGLLIVTKGGSQVLLNHREENPGDHVANGVILETLGITATVHSRLV